LSHERDIAETYRIKAEEIRIVAETDRHSETREMLLRVADDYEKMAATMESIAQTNEGLHK
jgi:hypothetical protein